VLKQTVIGSGETDDEFTARINESVKTNPIPPEVAESTQKPKKDVEKNQEPQVSPSSDRKNAVNQINLMSEQITEYCDLIGKSVLSINKDELKEAGIGEGSTDMLLTVALKKSQELAVAARMEKKANSDGTD
jgi:hypothetical protein